MALPDEAPRSYRTLHESWVVSVRDYTCRASRGAAQEEEHSGGDAVVLVRRGAFSRHFGRRTATADVNQAAFFSRGSTYRVSHSADCGDRGTIFQVSPRVLRDFVRELDPAAADAEAPSLPFATGPCETGVFWRHRELILRLERADEAPPDPLWADVTSLQLVADVLEAAFSRRGSSARRRRAGTDLDHAERVEATKTYLAGRMTERLTLGEVADAVAVSPFHLARLFRQRTGVPIHRYLTRLRLRASLEPLAEGASDLTEVALGLGFASHSHFADAFRREFGCAPSHVRRRATGKRLAETSKDPEA